MEQTNEYRKILQQQLVNKQRQRQCQYEDTLIEKKMQEGIMRTIADEDQRELQQKHDATEKMRREMVTSQQAREAWKQKQKQMVVLEEKKIEQQRQAASDRSSAIVAERERKMHLREEQTKKIGQKILADAAAIQERSDTIKLLQEQEYLEKNAQDDIAEIRKAELYREETKQYRDQLVKKREEEAWKLKEEDALYRKYAEDQMRLDNEKEHQTELLKKQKNKQYSMELCKQIDDNARRRKADHDLEEKMDKMQLDYDNSWCSEISKERKAIVEEHVPKLLGYLQAGVVESEDLPAVKAGVDKDRLPLDVESLAVSHRPRRFSKCNEQCRAEDQMSWDNENEDQKELLKKQRNKQYSMELCKQIDDNATRRKADHDVEEKRAKKEFDYDNAW